MEGYVCGIVTLRPTDDDFHEYQWMVLSDEIERDPSNNLFEISSLEEDYRTSSNFH